MTKSDEQVWKLENYIYLYGWMISNMVAEYWLNSDDPDKGKKIETGDMVVESSALFPNEHSVFFFIRDEKIDSEFTKHHGVSLNGEDLIWQNSSFWKVPPELVTFFRAAALEKVKDKNPEAYEKLTKHNKES